MDNLKKVFIFTAVCILCSNCFGSAFAYDVNDNKSDEQKSLDIVRIHYLEDRITDQNCQLDSKSL